MKQEYKEFLDWCKENDLLNSKNRLRGKSKANKHLKVLIEEAEEKIDKLIDFIDLPISKKLRYIIDNITKENYKCPVCSKPRGRRNGSAEIGITCGYIDEDHRKYIKDCQLKKMRKTCLELYGVEYVSQIEEVKRKKIENNLKKYGAPNYTQSEEYKENLTHIQKKKEETCLKKYGVKNISQADIIKKKKEETCLKKYGVENISQADIIKKKKEETCLKKYGVENISQADIIKSKYFNIKNYKKLSKEFIEENFIDENKNFNINAFIKFIGCSRAAAYRILHKYNIEWDYGPGGFDPNKPGTLYYIKDLETGLYKIGITNKSIEERFGKDFCSKRAMILLEQTYENGEQAYLAEQEILTAFSPYRCTNKSWPEEKGGKTEFFKEDILKMDK